MSGSQTPAPGLIAFAEIPYTWKVPGNYMEVKAAISANAVFGIPARGLVMGQMYATGVQATPGVIYNITSGQQANQLFGRGSMAAEMCWSFIAANPYTPLDAVGISDAAGATAAAGAFGFTGPATAAGTIPLYAGGVRVPVAVNQGDTAAIMAANAAAALQLQSQPGYKPLPGLAATYSTGTSVTMTATNKGTLGNSLDLRINYQVGDILPAGVGVTITAMTGGATDPAAQIATVLAGISTWYTDVAFAWTDTTNMGVFANWLNARYGAMTKLDAQGYFGLDMTYGTALAFLPNCKYISDLPMQNSLSPSWKIAACLAGASCYWKAQQPSLQMKTVPLPGIVAPAAADQFTQLEQEALLLAGHSTYYTDTAGNVYLQRVVTTYRTDPAENTPDNAWFDLNTTAVPTRVRYDWDNYIAQLYPRNNLCEDGTLAASFDPYAVTPGQLKASWTSRCAVYEQNGWIQNSAVTAKNSTFVIDANDGNRVDARQQIQIMGNLMVLAGSLEFISNN